MSPKSNFANEKNGVPPRDDFKMAENRELSGNVMRLPESHSVNELLEVKVDIPQSDSQRFSFRKLWAFSGPGFLMSIAFLDPGNIEADLKSGATANYELFWVVFWFTILGLLIQRLAARIGTITGQHLAEVCHSEYRVVPRIFIWIMMEVTIIGADMQEVVGTAISIYILSNGVIPLWGGVIVTVLDTLTFLFLDKYGLRKLELLFALLIGTMAVTFGYEFAVAQPSIPAIIRGIAVPSCTGCTHQGSKVLFAIGLIGSSITPPNLYLHSGLVKTRNIDRTKSSNISEANFYYLVEAGIALFVAFFINLFIMSVFAEGLYEKTNADLLQTCTAAGSSYSYLFSNNSDAVDVDIYSGGIFLGCKYGIAAMYIWAIGLLAAGQSSTMTGCYSGQFVMEGFLKLSWVRWKRVLLTRSFAILPSFAVAWFSTIDSFSGMNDFLNALMSIQLPFAVLPAIAFSSNSRICGEFANGLTLKIISVIIFVVIFSGNAFLVFEYVDEINKTWQIILLSIWIVFYAILCLYLVLHCAAALTSPDSALNRHRLMRKYVLGKSITDYYNEKEKVPVLKEKLEDASSSVFDVPP